MKNVKKRKTERKKNAYGYEKFTALFLFSHFSENHWKVCHEPSVIRSKIFKITTAEELYLSMSFH